MKLFQTCLAALVGLALALCLVLPGGAASAAVSTVYVRTDGNDYNCDGTADAAYPGGTGTYACAFQTLSRGILMVSYGGTVYVNGGTSDLVTINKSVTVIGTNTPVVAKFSFLSSLISVSGVSVGVIDVSNPGSMQDAVNAVNSGGTVNVASGDYGPVMVNKPLTLKGSGLPRVTAFSFSARPITATGFTVNTINISGTASIQDAINTVTNGGTVNVAVGSYPGGVLINKVVTLTGASGKDSNPANNALVDASGSEYGLKIARNGVTVQGLQISNAQRAGILLENPVQTSFLDRVTIQNCSIIDNVTLASTNPPAQIAAGYSDSTAYQVMLSNILIQNNIIGRSSGSQVDPFQAGVGFFNSIYANITITNNVFYGTPGASGGATGLRAGVLLTQNPSASTQSYQVNISTNTLTDVFYGVYLDGQALNDLVVLNGVVIQKNQFINHSASAVAVTRKAKNMTVDHNDFGPYIGLDAEDAAFRNIPALESVLGTPTQIFYPIQGLLFQNNRVFQQRAGLRLCGAASGAVLQCNEITGLVNVRHNSFTGLSAAGLIFDSDTAAKYNASPNWWGAGSGPTHATNPAGTGVSIETDRFYISPWLCDGTDTSTSPGFDHSTVDLCRPSADLGIEVTTGGTALDPGYPMVYWITVTNYGPAPVAGARVYDTFPAAMMSPTWTCTYSDTSSCGSGAIRISDLSLSLQPGASATIVASGTLSPLAIGTLSNTATMTVPYDVVDPGGHPLSATATNNITPGLDLVVVKTDGLAVATPGTPATYTFHVYPRYGPAVINGAVFSDTIPAVFSAAAWVCKTTPGSSCNTASGSGNSINVSVNLLVSGVATITVSGVFNPAVTETVINTAYVTPPAGTVDIDLTNNSATDTTQMIPMADLALDIPDALEPLQPGGMVTLSVRVVNTGPSQASGVQVRQTAPEQLTNLEWACTPSGGAVCPQAGALTALDMPPESSAVLTLRGWLPATASGVVEQNVDILLPAGLIDPVAGSSSAAIQWPVAGPPPVIQPPKGAYVDQNEFIFNEGGRKGIIVIHLTEAVTQTVQVDIKTSSGTAQAGIDFAGMENRLVFAPGELEKTLTITLLDNAVVDGSRDTYLYLSQPYFEGGVVAWPQAAACRIVIEDDDILVEKPQWKLWLPLITLQKT
ncbi:MAG TPA: Calx-beta domain-containing protein [Anaerolineaceae bacterium]|nr:Calx-beta domain-containing protein [Anaerolineaceae bacterium]HPN53679.1 Calx-beta domain-containing protein [Anaerolineaceae bacterium]